MSKSTPPAPNYADLARQQGAANVETARVEGQLNRPNIYTPNGSQVWQRNGDQYTLTESLNPQLAANNDLYNWIQGAALQNLGDWGVPALHDALSTDYSLPGAAQLGWDPNLAPDQNLQTESGMWAAPALQEGLDYGGAPGMPSASDDTRRTAEQAMYARGAQYLDPQFQGKRADLEARLANQGITMGSEAYSGEMQRLAQEEQQAYGDLQNRAIELGGSEMARQFGMGLDARQQGVGEINTQGQFANDARGQLISQLQSDMAQRNAAITGQANLASAQQQAAAGGRAAGLAEQAQATTMPINVLASLLGTSQVNAPQFQPFNNSIAVQPPPIFQAGGMQDQANMARYNAQQAGMSNWLRAGAGIASSFVGAPGVGAALISDRRAKRDIRQVGTWKGYPWYTFTVDGEPRQGVMSDEIPARFVRKGFADGFDRVDYAALAQEA